MGLSRLRCCRQMWPQGVHQVQTVLVVAFLITLGRINLCQVDSRAELMDAALQQYRCCYSQIEIFGCLGLHFHIHMQFLTTGFQMASSLRKLCFK